MTKAECEPSVDLPISFRIKHSLGSHPHSLKSNRSVFGDERKKKYWLEFAHAGEVVGRFPFTLGLIPCDEKGTDELKSNSNHVQ